MGSGSDIMVFEIGARQQEQGGRLLLFDTDSLREYADRHGLGSLCWKHLAPKIYLSQRPQRSQ